MVWLDLVPGLRKLYLACPSDLSVKEISLETGTGFILRQDEIMPRWLLLIGRESEPVMVSATAEVGSKPSISSNGSRNCASDSVFRLRTWSLETLPALIVSIPDLYLLIEYGVGCVCLVHADSQGRNSKVCCFLAYVYYMALTSLLLVPGCFQQET